MSHILNADVDISQRIPQCSGCGGAFRHMDTATCCMCEAIIAAPDTASTLQNVSSTVTSF